MSWVSVSLCSVRYAFHSSAEALLEDPKYETAIVGVALYLLSTFFLLFAVRRMIMALAHVCIQMTDSVRVQSCARARADPRVWWAGRGRECGAGMWGGNVGGCAFACVRVYPCAACGGG